jgi:hypothetical protein
MDFVKAALRQVTKDKQTLTQLEEMTSLSMQERRESAEKELAKIWEDEHIQPITYHNYTDNVQAAR